MPQNYLAIDYGERRIGIAFACGSVGIAFPRETIDLSKKSLWVELERLVKENKITDFVLGLPIHPNNHPDSKQKTVEMFADELHAKFPQIELHIQDESYSTQEAITMIGGQIKNKERIDKAAATIILQRFLEGSFKCRSTQMKQ
ncbi:MAG: Holliday junction resolvase RuvX [Fibromonadaceae bacterium]|jgi:putative Holliday junction resolvase|nr:Holliday junction resolvase RuvX [Fibromonadaceae bacterium]